MFPQKKRKEYIVFRVALFPKLEFCYNFVSCTINIPLCSYANQNGIYKALSNLISRILFLFYTFLYFLCISVSNKNHSIFINSIYVITQSNMWFELFSNNEHPTKKSQWVISQTKQTDKLKHIDSSANLTNWRAKDTFEGVFIIDISRDYSGTIRHIKQPKWLFTPVGYNLYMKMNFHWGLQCQELLWKSRFQYNNNQVSH